MQAQTHAKLVVTVGSTRFPALSDAVLSPRVLDALPALGVSSVTVQLGSADIPVHARGQEFTYSTDAGKYVQVKVLRYTKDAVEMDALLKDANVVVSHAGEWGTEEGTAPETRAKLSIASRRS